jgi:hypothetical protein
LANNSSDIFQTIFTLLFIIFFVISGFFRKTKGKKKGKTPYKPVMPLPPRAQKKVKKQVPGPPYKPKPLTPANMKGFFEEVLMNLGEAKEEQPEEVRKPTLVKEVSEPEKVIPFKDIGIKPDEKEEPLRIRRRQKLKEARAAARAEKRKGKKKAKILPKKIGMELFFDKTGMQRAVIMSEILQKPLALRKRNVYPR